MIDSTQPLTVTILLANWLEQDFTLCASRYGKIQFHHNVKTHPTPLDYATYGAVT